MRKALKQNASRQQTAQAGTVPPPVGGWNAHDALSAMGPTDAVSLVNWVPDVGAVRVRPGYSSWVTGLGSSIQSLMEYAPPTGSNKLFAAAGTAVYNVTASGAVGAAVVSTTTNARWQHTMFATAAGNFLVACNGAKAVQNYDGTNWTSPAITGVTSANLIAVMNHMNRLWFAEKDTLSIWYLPVSSIAGAATKFDIAPLCVQGGYLLAMASWTHDGGAGPEDHAVFVTSKGELLVYQGQDPADASTWRLVGRYKIPEPIGRRCFIKAGGDLGILTSQGLVPMSQVLGVNESGADSVSFTNKIDGAFSAAYQASGTNFGWQVIQYPKRNLVMVNVPVTESLIQEQYVMNVKNGSWCRFTGMNAGCWSLMGDSMFFGDNTGTVWKFGEVLTDNALPITASLQSAFSPFGTPANKRFTNAKPLFLGPTGAVPRVSIKVDYDTSPAGIFTTTLPDPGTAWDLGDWDTTSWGEDAAPIAVWQPVSAYPGVVGSIAFSVSTATALSYNGATLMYEAGGLL